MRMKLSRIATLPLLLRTKLLNRPKWKWFFLISRRIQANKRWNVLLNVSIVNSPSQLNKMSIKLIFSSVHSAFYITVLKDQTKRQLDRTIWRLNSIKVKIKMQVVNIYEKWGYLNSVINQSNLQQGSIQSIDSVFWLRLEDSNFWRINNKGLLLQFVCFRLAK